MDLHTAGHRRGVVCAPHSAAVEAGRATLAEGGNALEAMLAMAASIVAVYPHMTHIGGDGFWLIRLPSGRLRTIMAPGPAALQAKPELYRDYETIPTRGPLAALTVPGAIGGWILALQAAKAARGKMPLNVLLAPAIAQARNGYVVTRSQTRLTQENFDGLKDVPGFAATFLADGKVPAAGAILKQEALAATLAQLAHAGLDDFYRGDVGREIAADLERIGSPVTRSDLKAYGANWREPLILRLKKATLYNTPAPTQGLASLMLLGLYEHLAPRSVDGFEHAHALIEGFKRASAVRDRVCVDFRIATDDFAHLLSAGFLDSEAAKIDERRAAPWPLRPAKGDTIWMGAIDANGIAVSFIQSLYWEFGSGCVLERTGVTMPNRGVAFPLDPAARNALRPGRRPFHTLNPPLAVFDDGRVMSYGSMGGDGQPQFQAQVFTRIAAGAALADAVAAPRHLFGRTWGEASASVKLEAGYDDATAGALARAGHEIEWRAPKDCDVFGHAGALVRNPKGAITATHDPRSDGGPAGL